MNKPQATVDEVVLGAHHSRRDVLRFARWAAVGVGVAGVAGAFGVSLLHDGKITKVTRATFADQVGSEFTLRSGSVKATARLTQITGLPAALDAVDEHRFVLVFASSNTSLEQSTYTFSHPSVADVDIFIVPTRDADGATVYEAVFNQAPDGSAS